MPQNKGTLWLYTASLWIARLACLNILFLLFTLLGFGLFGVFPALFAMISVLRQWLRGEETRPVRMFWRTYRRSFLYANRLGACLLVCAAILLSDLYVLWHMKGTFSQLAFFVLLYVGCVLLIASFYMLCLGGGTWKVKELGKQGLLRVFYKPVSSIAILATLLLCGWVSLHMQILLFFFTFSVTCLACLLLSGTDEEVKARLQVF
ncbi:DUF624 domain-containing protein [Ectobacillus sp. JY-23]|uniref:YesL family protein n=1 Tax=Ectobacillus sp. JY-23 TaxID=2933872 RepID=UPI001FF0E206|nr:DUF624 domain-containing protein [Ectobacillus sp. JY-23]UOY92240.1 DUF624 domain-containing protein [Ectobacillus sp. JY-23]